MLYTPQTTAAQTAFASLSSASLLETVRSIANLPGSFSLKNIKSKPYWYYQTPDLTGGQTQIFIGRATAELTALIDIHRNGSGAKFHLKQLAQQAMAVGCPYITASHAKIIARLSDAGFFQAGGILVGTHVFMGYQNYLGLRWVSGAQTADLDFANAGKNISVAIPSDVKMDMGTAIDSLKMGFVPVKSLTTYVKSDESDLQIDFITSMHRGGDTPVLVKALNATMQPLKFMEFSMEAPIQLVLLAQQGPITVTVPPPEKYAVHKLLVYGERPQSGRVKSLKDLEQAAALIEYLGQHDAQALNAAWVDLIGRGDGWLQRAQQGLLALKERYPSIDTRALAL